LRTFKVVRVLADYLSGKVKTVKVLVEAVRVLVEAVRMLVEAVKVILEP
jgi:hypothetical protein